MQKDLYKQALTKLEKNINGFCVLQEYTHLGNRNNTEHHNCLACQLKQGDDRLARFLRESKTGEDEEYDFTIFILLMYLQVEKLNTIFKFIGITQDYVEENWQVLIEIRKWANFVKHPKGFLFTHHPIFVFETAQVKKNSKTKVLDYKTFVSKFYNHENKDYLTQTIQEIGNKQNITVVIPSPLRLIKEYLKVSASFCKKVKSNPHFKEVLKKHTTINDYNEDSPTVYVINEILHKN